MWAFCIGYAVFIFVSNVVVLVAKPHWRGWGLILASAAIGPVVVVIMAIALLSAPDADGTSNFWTYFFAFVGFFATLGIGALVSSIVWVYVRQAIERNSAKPD